MELSLQFVLVRTNSAPEPGPPKAAMGGGGGGMTLACFFPPQPLRVNAARMMTRTQAERGLLTAGWT